jgi:hypothetical protein
MVHKGFKGSVPPQMANVVHTPSTGSSPEKTGVVPLAIPSQSGGGLTPHE